MLASEAWGIDSICLQKNAYLYLKHFQGIDFLLKFYNTLHLQSIEDTVDDLVIICQKQGGALA